MLTIQDRVSNGCRLLTEHFGNDEWVWRVNLKWLYIGSCSMCMIGQLFQTSRNGKPVASYYRIVDEVMQIGRDGAVSHGFENGDVDIEDLTAEWRRQITALRASQSSPVVEQSPAESGVTP